MARSTSVADSRAGGSIAARSGTSSIGNSLLALAAIGVGLILLATGAGSSPVGAVPLLGLGAASFAWAVVVLVRDRVPGLRASFASAVGAVIVWVALAALSSIGATTVPPLLPMVSSTILLLAIAGVLATRLRRDASAPVDDGPTAHRRPGAGRYVLTLFAGAAIVAALTTPALAQTRAGAFAVPHGSHGSLHDTR